MRSRARKIAIVVTQSVIVVGFLTVLCGQLAQIGYRPPRETKVIVSYSLGKLMEIESETIRCDAIGVDGSAEAARNYAWSLIPDTKLSVYSVHVDDRLAPHRYLRIIGMYKGTWNGSIYCRTIASGKYHTTKARRTDIWSKSWNKGDEETYNPVLISCQTPRNATNVTLTNAPCKPSNKSLPITKDETKGAVKRKVTICVKPLNFAEDVSERLVQWIEINKILGADEIYIYVDKIPETVRRILKWYERERRYLKVINFEKVTLESPTQNGYKKVWQKRKHEVVPYNDCFYRNLDASDYIVPLDVDEIIVPRKFRTWGRLLDDLAENVRVDDFASLSVRNAYFLRKFSNESVFFMGSSIRNEYSDEEESGKSFVSTKNALTVFNHYALHALKPGVKLAHFLSPDVVQMNHYRETCSIELLPECVKYLHRSKKFKDEIVMKYKREFDVAYGDTLKRLRRLNLL